MSTTQYRKVILMDGNIEVASKFVKFVNGKNAEPLDFGRITSNRVTRIVVCGALPII